jgi:2-dehydro-3-deoxyphosphogluconate aldolase / (4S)-4-hydroxy-2-oxoglutarate aldolase
MDGLNRLRGRTIPVIRMGDAANARTAVSWLQEGGLNIFEITASVPHYRELISELAALPDCYVGAGTILNRGDARAAIGAGARFLVSPCMVKEVLDTGRDAGIPVLPGAATPTEVHDAYLAGAAVVKIFPAKQLGGADYLKALRSVFPQIPLMPTGGIDLDDVPGYFGAGAAAVGMGSQLVTEEDVRNGRYDAVRARAAKLAALSGE